MELKISTKYNIPAPRYTSYPTAPNWKNNLEWENWLLEAKKTFLASNDQEGISLYVHLPFCEHLCTYCGCTKHITKNHSVEDSYIQAVLQEWELYQNTFGQQALIREIHLGGGTPTFFSPDNLRKLIKGLLRNSRVHPRREFSFEGHPNNTSREHLQALFDLGFRRVSFGIQDISPMVQESIHRIQPIEKVIDAVSNAREIGYNSINFDLIYGLPHQSIMSLINTMDQVIKLLPDRIAFYSYAHVPSLFPAQKSYEAFLPNEREKLDLYLFGKNMLQGAGYVDIGMDHFCLPEEKLAKASIGGLLHRNFMGYTTQATSLLIGLGSSSISDAGHAFFQNTKNIKAYQENLQNHGNPGCQKSHLLSPEEESTRQLILDISCKGQGQWSEEFWKNLPKSRKSYLQDLVQDGLIRLSDRGLQLTDFGKGFLRLVCAAFDPYFPLEKILHPVNGETSITGFSKAI